MRSNFVYILSLALLLCASSLSAFTLKETPIQTQFISEISNSFDNVLPAADFSSDEFSSPPIQESSKKVSLLKAGIYSALIPGLGEYYVGHRGKAKVFFAVEAATWISFFSFHIYGNWKKDDYIDYAAIHANANLENKNDEFRDWVGFYNDIDQFNSLGRVQDPDRPYLEDNPDNHWQWQSSSEQEVYRNLKNRSREAHRRRDFMIGLAIVTRIVSIVDAVRDAKRAQRTIDDTGFSIAGSIKYRVELNPFNPDRPVSMALFTRF